MSVNAPSRKSRKCLPVPGTVIESTKTPAFQEGNPRGKTLFIGIGLSLLLLLLLLVYWYGT